MYTHSDYVKRTLNTSRQWIKLCSCIELTSSIRSKNQIGARTLVGNSSTLRTYCQVKINATLKIVGWLKKTLYIDYCKNNPEKVKSPNIFSPLLCSSNSLNFPNCDLYRRHLRIPSTYRCSRALINFPKTLYICNDWASNRGTIIAKKDAK